MLNTTMSPELSGGPFRAEDRNKMSPRWNPGSIEPERTTTTLRKEEEEGRGERRKEGDDQDTKKRTKKKEGECRVFVFFLFTFSPSSFLPKKYNRLTGDSEPVKRISDFQIISAEVMMRPAGW